jgi:hypothetical protein
MITRRPERCLSDHVLDRLVAGELHGAPADEARGHLSTCGVCTAQFETFREGASHFPSEVSIQAEVKAVCQRQRRHTIRRFAMSFSGAAAAVLLALVVLPAEEPAVRTKGGLSLEVIAKHGDGKVEQVLPGARLSPGDAIRFRIASEEGGYLAIAGIDSAQVVSIYHAPVKIERSEKERLLEGSIILDGTLGPEQIAAIVCHEPPQEANVVAVGRAALDRVGGDPRRVSELELGCRQAFFLIEKVAR